MEKTKIAGAVGVAAGLVLAGLVGAGLADESAKINELQEQVTALSNVEPVVIEHNNTVEVPVEVPVEVEKIVEVDNGNLDLVLEHLYDNDGDVEYLLDDLDDNKLGLFVERIVFINDIKKLAVDYVKKEGTDELDKEVVNGIELDDSDIERFKVDDDDEDLIIDDVYFEDGDAEVLVSARFEQDDIKYEAVFRVEFEDGEAEDISVESISLR